MTMMFDRRGLLRLGGAGIALTAFPGLAFAGEVDPTFVPIRVSQDLVTHITVCLRPFRRAGPRIEVEKLGSKTVVHNYGHGGSGWSLSWGSAEEALALARQTGERKIAVIGAGAIGLTVALTALRAGMQVTIYAKERFPEVRSARATGTWSPDSRVAMQSDIDEAFAQRWERMARTSFARFNEYMAKGSTVEITDRYFLGDHLPEPEVTGSEQAPAVIEQPPQDEFAEHLNERLGRLFPRLETLNSETSPFAPPYVRRNKSMTFNIAQLAAQLTAEIIAAGGKFVRKEFHEPADTLKLKEKTVINCTGYGAAKLWNDKSLIPSRGQIGWMAAQPGAFYGVVYHGVQLLGRRDGIVIQNYGSGLFEGYNNADETPDAAETAEAVARLQGMWRTA